MNRLTIALLSTLILLPAPAAAQRFTPVTAPALTGSNPNSGLNDVAYNDKQGVYLQVWGHPVVYGRFITADGAPIGSGPFVIAQQSESDAMPRVEYSSGGADDVFIVRFTSELNHAQYLFLRLVRYTANGPEMGPIQMVYGGGGAIARAGGLAYNPSRRQVLLTWETPSDGWEVFGQLWQLSGSASSPSIAAATGNLNISEMNNAQGTPNVAYDFEHDRYMVVFRGEHPASALVKGSWARLVAFDGNNAMSKSGVIELSSGFGEPAEQNVVYMPDADSYLTYWTDITRARDLTGRIVNDVGVATTGTFPILATSGNEGAADGAYNPSTGTIMVGAMREQTKYVQGIELSGWGVVGEFFQATTAIPSGGLESLFPHISAAQSGRFAVSYVNTYQFVWFELLQGTMGGGGTPPPPPPPPPPPTCEMSFSSTSASFGALGGGGGFTMTIGSTCAWSMNKNADWIVLGSSSLSGTGSKTISYTVLSNGSTSNRTGIIYSGNRSITISQSGTNASTLKDFNFDGINDLIWQNSSTGELAIWRMRGVNIISGDYMSPANIGDTNWKIMGTLDADRDGSTDLLLQHDAGYVEIWRMVGDTRAEIVILPASVEADPRWRIVGTGDMDRDGYADIFWQHPDGAVAVWYLNGTGFQIRESIVLANVSDSRWRVAGIEDFNHDGKLDILWRHTGWGQLLAWYMDDRQFLNSGMNIIMANSNWKIAALGDFSGDGKPDLIWHNTVTGELAAWFMDNSGVVNSWSLNPGRVTDTNWRLVGPR
jgi:hypothetical protein